MSGGRSPIGEDDLQAYVDDRLDAVRRDQVEAYLAQHPDIRDRLALDRSNRDSLRAQLAGKHAEPIPSRLRIASLRAARRETALRRLRTIAAATAIFLVGAAGGWIAGRLQPSATGTGSIAHNATAAYRTFVVEAAHPVEVDASKQAHLLHWLSKRLGRPLTAPDLSKFGYRLMGGRLLPAGSGAAAQLMYDDANGSRLTLFVQAAAGGETAFRFRQEAETSTFAWIDQGFGFAVTARVSREQLLPIAEAIYLGLGGKAGDHQKGSS